VEVKDDEEGVCNIAIHRIL